MIQILTVMLQMQLRKSRITITLLDIAGNELNLKERLKAIQDINAIRQILGNLTLENIGTDKARLLLKYNVALCKGKS
jgi:hypothetical protein